MLLSTEGFLAMPAIAVFLPFLLRMYRTSGMLDYRGPPDTQQVDATRGQGNAAAQRVALERTVPQAGRTRRNSRAARENQADQLLDAFGGIAS